MTISDKLLSINNSKTAIKDAIEAKGVTVGAIPLAQYPGKIAEIEGGGGGDWPPPDPVIDTWVRPVEWVALPSVTEGSNTFAGVLAVFNTDFNQVTIVTTFSGSYTIDWGDGTVQSYTDATQTHTYDFTVLGNPITDRGIKTAAVTITPDVGSSITAISLREQVGLTGNRANPWLDVIVDASIDVTLSSTLATLSTASILQRYREVGISTRSNRDAQFLSCSALRVVDVDFRNTTSANTIFGDCTSLQVIEWQLAGSQNVSFAMTTSSGWVRCRSLKLVRFKNVGYTGIITTLGFRDCTSLEKVLSDAPIAINASDFLNCYNLTQLPIVSNGLVVAASLFSSCYSLTSRALYEAYGDPIVASGSNLSLLFNFCTGLKTVRLNIGGTISAFNNAFQNCYGLESVTLNTEGRTITQWNSTFSGCGNLRSVEGSVSTFQHATNTFGMFNGCTSLEVDGVPEINYAGVTSAGSMFTGCVSLSATPTINLPVATTISSMFSGCNELVSINLTGISPFGTTNNALQNTFINCRALTVVPAVDASRSRSTGHTVMFNGTGSIRRSLMSGMKRTHSYASNMLNAAALVEIFTNLGTAEASQIITITGNPGVADLTQEDRDIAINKGWGITS